MSNVTGPDEAQQKNQKFDELVDLHQTALLRMCFIYLQDQALAQDAVQETFLKAYRSMDLFRGDSSEKTWLIRIAVNTCRDLRRSAVEQYMKNGVQLVDREGNKVLSTGCLNSNYDAEKGMSIQLPLAAFTGELPDEIYLAPVIGFDSRWDETTPAYDPGFEKPDNVVASFQFDFEKGFRISLNVQ